MDIKPLELLKKALLSAEDETLLNQVRKRAGEIVEALEEDEIEFSEVEINRLLEAHPEWTAAVYEALGPSEDLTADEKAISEALGEIRRRNDEELAHAFAHALLETLPDRFHDWDQWFGAAVPKIPGDYQAYLSEQPIVQEGRPYSEGLIKYGMTPGTFIEASRGIGMLVDRSIRMARGPEERWPEGRDVRRLYSHISRAAEFLRELSVDGVLLKDTSRQDDPSVIPYSLLLAQVRTTPQCPPEAAEPLLHWMVDVAQLKPYFFAGYWASTLGKDAVRLREDPTHRDAELMWRWGRQATDADSMQGPRARRARGNLADRPNTRK